MLYQNCVLSTFFCFLALRHVHNLFQNEFFRDKFQYSLFSVRLSSNCLLLLPRLFITSILLCTYPSVSCLRKKLLHKMRPIQLDFLSLLHAGPSSSPWLREILIYFSHDRSDWFSPAWHFQTFQLFLTCKCLIMVNLFNVIVKFNLDHRLTRLAFACSYEWILL
jgi:hypothetical protein